MLDLDGDGIETTSTRDGTIILFDHDADGVKTGTSWVKPDDGWLVLDRDSNGVIDSGRELFGVDTLKNNGQLATDGFDALKDLDANADGKIDATDSVFANLRIWRDLNQDGISQANELTALGANSIISIGVDSTAVRTDLGNGNLQTAAGFFTRSDGAAGTTGETNGAAANLDLLVNTFYRQFTDPITLTAQAMSLPTLRGSGQVRDLNEAVSLSADLGNFVQTYAQQATRQGQIDLLDGFIAMWADTSDLKSLKAQAAGLADSGITLNYRLAGLIAGTAAYDDFLRKLGVVERFMGYTYGGANGQARFTPLDGTSGNLTVSLAAEQISSIALAYDRFKTDIYESLLLETRLSSYFNKLDIAVNGGSVTLSYAPLEDAFRQAIAASPRDGIIDLVEFLSAAGETSLKNLGWNATDFLVNQINAAPDQAAFSEELSSWTVHLAASTEHSLTGTSRPDLLVGSEGDDSIQGNYGNDLMIGKAGNDFLAGGVGDDSLVGGDGTDALLGGVGNDMLDGGAGDDNLDGGADADSLFGGEGDDLLQGGTGNDILLGGAGNDILEGGNGDDTLTGGAGDDTLRGGSGDDTYVWGSGLGNDRVYFETNDWNTPGFDTLRLTNLNAGDVTLYRDASGSLKVTASATGETFDVIWGLRGDVAYANVEQLQFADGTVWGMEQIRVAAVRGTAGDDFIYGNEVDDTIDGLTGNDTIRAGGGNDTVIGGEGNDILEGGAGIDTLLGGEGSDTLRGGMATTP